MNDQEIYFESATPDDIKALVDLRILAMRETQERIGFVVVRHGAVVLGVRFAEADAEAAFMRVGALRDSDSNRFYARHDFELVEQAEWDNYYVRNAKG